MSTLRINNIEAKSVPASPTIDEKVKITNSSGDVLIHIDGKTSGITTIGINTTAGNIKFDANSNVVVTGIITATKFVGVIEPTDLTVSGKVSVGGSVTAATFYGNGANLTGITGTTINNNADNRLITGSGTANTLEGESTLTYDGNTLQNLQSGAAANLTLKTTSNSFNSLILDSNRAADTQFGIIDGRWNGNVVNRIQFVTGSDGTNKDDGYMAFHTRTSGASLAERLRIDSSGKVNIGNTGSSWVGPLSIGSGASGVAQVLQLYSNSDTYGAIFFGDADSGAGRYVGDISYYHDNNYMRFSTGGNERLRIDSSGGVHIATTSGNEKLNVHGAIRASGSSANFNAGLEGALVDYDTSNNIARFGHVNGASGSARSVTFVSGGTERLRITSGGFIGAGTANPRRHFHLHNSASATVGFQMTNGNTGESNDSQGFQLKVGSDSHAEISQMENSDLRIFTNATERLRIQNDGKTGIGYNAPRQTLEVNSTHDTTANKITPVLRLSTGTSYSGSNTGSGLEFGTTNTSYPTWIKGRIGALYNGSSNYGGHLVFETNSGSAAESSNSEKMRISDKGLITNTTQSTHPQGAGTFEIKGVISQYSQGSGSGLIFDCDFGRLTGYDDDNNVNNGTDLSSCLSHSTTDWTSSSSNTPMTVNGGTLQYRTGFGGYMEGISNGGRVSVGAGSGAPSFSDKLNIASMTIECWCWYDGDGREVLVSRYGSGYPNQFNMLTDPNGQFHFNSSGVGAGAGNISGEHFPDKTWHHHVWQYDSGSGTLHRWYINGAFANSYDSGSSLAVSSGTGIGIFSRADRAEDFRGKIAVVRIYNRALSATEIKNHFELDRGRFGV